MKISIITVTFNCEFSIRDTIKSVISQSYQNIEHIIIDGGSTDSTIKIIHEYKKKISYFISEPDNGMYDALNKGILASTGDLIGFLHSDDMFKDKNVISKIAKESSDLENFSGIYADLEIVRKNNIEIITRKYSSKNFKPWQLRFGMMFPHPTFYVKSNVYKKYGLYKTNYRVSADFELILRYHKKGLRFKRININMIKMREGGLSNNGIFWKIHQNFEIVRACRENNVYSNIFFIFLKLPFKLIAKYNV